ncbi:hypothetical protein [Seonamhaeicola marinus]|uniref:Uncharacterized protein n=1 Tax=Seonamhaeicola marinus TaxID=1912246 RepID=A0A5D0J106_9FLAO|nr:hypothetical protein [Seonamhaeicola marinus]TYA89256.1 hypothetical protein FUA24_03745 [Seonamhaeicola marinus]
MIEDFVNKLKLLRPNEGKLTSEGYSRQRIDRIYSNEFELNKKNNENCKFLLDYFIKNYDLNNFRLQNLFFTNNIETDIIQGYHIFGFIEGGYIFYENTTRMVYTAYAEDIVGTTNLLCNNDKQFFDILLIVGEYSSKSYEGIDIEEYELYENYINRCQMICQEGYFEPLFI